MDFDQPMPLAMLLGVSVAIVAVMNAVFVWTTRRRAIRTLAEFLNKNYAETSISHVSKGVIHLSMPPLGNVQCSLPELRKLLSVEGPDEDPNLIIFHFLANAEIAALNSAPSDAIFKAIMPRVESIHSSKQNPEFAKRIPNTPLLLFCVIGLRTSLVYVNDRQLREWKMTRDSLIDLAMSNLRKLRGVPQFRESLDKNQSLTYAGLIAAERLLLIPEILAPGEEAIVGIPSRHILRLWPLSGKIEWPEIWKSVQFTDGEILCPHPLQVSRDGFITLDENGRPLPETK